MNTLSHWIDGAPRTGSSGRTGNVFDPATGRVRSTVELGSAADVDAAVGAALRAFRPWRDTSLGRRAQILFAFRDAVHRAADRLAEAVSAEHGKVAADARGEVARGLEVVDFACGIPHLLKGDFSEGVSTDVDSYSIRQPVGVCAGITPFNFPMMVPLWMAPLAIACGNSFVLKPSEKAPTAPALLGELWAEAGLPPGVFNVVHGDREAVERLLKHPDVGAISFAGSTPVARTVYTTGTANGKRVQALGGAKNHMIVLPDADPEVVADAAVSAAFGSSGERCMAVSVVVAVDPVGDDLLVKLKECVGEIRVGSAEDPTADMGPLITRDHRDRVASYLETSTSLGADLAVDGRAHPAPDGAPDGFWLGPSVVDHVTPEMSVYRDEIFGPVLSIVRVPSYEAALELVNSNPYGNGAAVFTRDGGAARRFQYEVQAGMVGINVPVPVPVAYYAFGGWKASLFGDSHTHGTEAVRFYTRGKVVTARWPRGTGSGVDLGFPTTE